MARVMNEVDGDAGFEIFEFAERDAVERSLDQLRVLGYDPAYLFDIDSDRVAPLWSSRPKVKTSH